MSRNAERHLNQKTINMNHTFFSRTANKGVTTEMTFDVISDKAPSETAFSKELDNLLAQGKIIAYGYTTLLPY
jgi:D-arabinose 1-dehydrogenase-like Zn-dependent alcohol dehydrogenase